MKLLDYLPDYLKDIKEIQEIMDVEDIEIEDLKTAIEDILNQKFIDIATWGLELWERELGLAINPNLTYSERRSKIKSKIRGIGKVDSSLIKEVADSWTNGDVEISFDGKINIKFISIFGIPSNIEIVKNAINEIVPTHLGVVYLFAYLFIADVEAMTIAELETKTLDKFAGGVV
ncbi:MAG: putative phage tail protein [Vulcanibacillus sp.]